MQITVVMKRAYKNQLGSSTLVFPKAAVLKVVRRRRDEGAFPDPGNNGSFVVLLVIRINTGIILLEISTY